MAYGITTAEKQTAGKENGEKLPLLVPLLIRELPRVFYAFLSAYGTVGFTR